MRKTNFAHVPIYKQTKDELDKLKDELEINGYNNVSYEELMKIFLEKNKKVKLLDNDIRRILSSSRGVKI